MTEVNPYTKLGRSILWDYDNRNYGDIWDAYRKPSGTKEDTYIAIRERARITPGYRNDLKVVAKSSHFYSTVYSYEECGTIFIVKDTAGNTYRTVLV